MQMRHDARRLQAEGLSIRQVAAKLDLPPTTVANWLPTAAERSQFDRMMRLRLEGMNNQQIADQLGVIRQRVAAVLGPVPRRKTRGKRRTIDLSPETWDGARQVARDLGLRAVQGSAEGTGSIGMLLDAIAYGEVSVTWVGDHGPHDPLGATS